MRKQIKHQVKRKTRRSNRLFIFVSTGEGLVKIFFTDIIYFSGAGSYSDIHLRNKKTIENVCFNLADFERYLPHNLFFRIHKHILANIEHIKKYRTRQLIMDDESLLPVSKEKTQPLLRLLPVLKHGIK